MTGGRPQPRFPGELIADHIPRPQSQAESPPVSPIPDTVGKRSHLVSCPAPAATPGHVPPPGDSRRPIHSPGSTPRIPLLTQQFPAVLGVATYQKPSLECAFPVPAAWQARTRCYAAPRTLAALSRAHHSLPPAAAAGPQICCLSWTSMAWSRAATPCVATPSVPKRSSRWGRTSPAPYSWSHRDSRAWGAQSRHPRFASENSRHMCGRAYTFARVRVALVVCLPMSNARGLRGPLQPPRSLLAERPMEVQRRHEGRHRTQYWDDAARTGGA